jgi:lipid-binding SYLF domain-containing protein
VKGTTRTIGAARAFWLVLGIACLATHSQSAQASSAAELDRDSKVALEKLLTANDGARALAKEAHAVLVFPRIVKGGFVFGGQFGDGALREGGRAKGYYRSIAASYGLQAGLQQFGYALFFMNEKALHYFHESQGFELGVGPSIVVLDHGMAGALSTTTARSDIYAVFFDQKGLMAGLGIQGTKITPIHPH